MVGGTFCGSPLLLRLLLQLLKLFLELLKLPFELAATTILQCNTGRFSFRWHDQQIVTESEFPSNIDLPTS